MTVDPKHILIIDDDALLRSGIRVYLEDSGYEVTEAGDGAAGVACVRAEPPDLILCDLRMPGMDGLKVLQSITDLSSEIPIIVVTGQGVLQDAIAALRHGAWDFITKPIKEMAILEHSIERALERARLVRENRLYREHLEEEVAHRTAELQEREAHLKSIFAAFHRAFVMVFDENGEVITVEGPGELRERYGISREAFPTIPVQQLLSPKHVEEHRRAVQQVLATGKPLVAEVPATFPTGRFWIEVTHSAMRNSAGQITAVLGFIQDVTKRHEAEEEKARLESQLRQTQKLEAIGTLAGGIAHDFNNILSAILGFTHIALQDTKDLPGVQATLEEVYTAGKRAASLVKQILTFSRRTEQTRAPLLIAPVVKEALKLLRASVPANIEIRQEIDPGCGAIIGDPTEVHQVVLNLGTNAYHAMRSHPRGTLSYNIKPVDVLSDSLLAVQGLEPGAYLRMRVQDTGDGMPQEVLEHIFEPFYTTKPLGEGTGMGLAIVHGIVTSYGGHIDVRSAAQEGTAFDVYFPCAGSTAEPETNMDRPLRTGTGRILLVDDEQPLVALGEMVLERLGYYVTGCDEARNAIEFFKIDPDGYDCVITDHSMPQMTGLHLAAELRSIRPGIPVILMSGFTDDILQKDPHARERVNAILSKPVDAFVLAETLHQVLRARTG